MQEGSESGSHPTADDIICAIVFILTVGVLMTAPCIYSVFGL